jgi:hypothetical protein
LFTWWSLDPLDLCILCISDSSFKMSVEKRHILGEEGKGREAKLAPSWLLSFVWDIFIDFYQPSEGGRALLDIPERMSDSRQALSIRAQKVRGIFNQFDSNKDGCLNRSEMAALVMAVHPASSSPTSR